MDSKDIKNVMNDDTFKRDMIEQSHKILDGKHKICIIYGNDDDRKLALYKWLKDIHDAAELPLSLIENDDTDEYVNEVDVCLDNITLRLLVSHYFIIQADLNTLSSGKIDDLVIGCDLFRFVKQLVGTEISRNRKLIILTDSNPHDFFFEGGKIKHFSEFIPMNMTICLQDELLDCLNDETETDDSSECVLGDPPNFIPSEESIIPTIVKVKAVTQFYEERKDNKIRSKK